MRTEIPVKSLTPATQASLPPLKRNLSRRAIWHMLSWCFPLAWLLHKILPQIGQVSLPSDTSTTYLPLANRLLQAPMDFFSDPASMTVAPGSYVHMALAGGNVALLEIANAVMAVAILFLLWDAARRLAGNLAAATSAWLYAVSPLLTEYAIAPQSEPPFIFLTSLWFWAMVWLWSMPPRAAGRRAIILLAALALGCATLTRATYMYWIPCAVLTSALLLWRGPATWKNFAFAVLVSHLLAGSMVGAWVLHNQLKFDKAAIATGAGGALYFGNNPVLGGYEPPYFNLMHDNISATWPEISHLSLAGDKQMSAVAKAMILNTPPATLATMYLQKAGAILFFSKVNIRRTLLNERAWRIVLLLGAALGVWRFRRNPFVILLAGATLYQVTVHIPVLYNNRYSISALEIPLTLLASLGWAALIQTTRPWRLQAWSTAFVITMLAILAGAAHQRYTRPLMPQLSKGPHALLATADASVLDHAHWSQNPWQGAALSLTTHPELLWRNIPLGAGAISIVEIKLRALDDRCKVLHLELQHNGQSQPHTHTVVELRGRGLTDDITFGIASLAINHSAPHSDLRMRFECPVGASAHFERAAIYHASMGAYYLPRLPTTTPP